VLGSPIVEPEEKPLTPSADKATIGQDGLGRKFSRKTSDGKSEATVIEQFNSMVPLAEW